MLVRLAICLLLADAEDVHQRLLHVLGAEADMQAEALLKKNQYSAVEKMLSDLGGTGNETRALRGVLEFLDGRMEGSVQAFAEAASTGKLRQSDRFTMAMALVRLGREEEARTELKNLAAEFPMTALYRYWLGRIDYDQRRYQEAVEQLKRATELDAALARAWDSLGLAYDMQGKEEEALGALNKAVALNRQQPKKSAWPPHDLGTVLLRTGETSAAVSAFREALEYEPAMAQAHYHLGRALEKENADLEAVNEYLIAVKQDDQSADACYSLAMLYRKLHRDKEAQDMFAEWRKRRGSPPQ